MYILQQRMLECAAKDSTRSLSGTTSERLKQICHNVFDGNHEAIAGKKSKHATCAVFQPLLQRPRVSVSDMFLE